MADLSGNWLGTYWQEDIPTRFELSLIQGGNTLSGNILDDSDLGEASLVGEVIGRNINFTKQYLIGHRHCVQYTGTVSEDKNFMQGHWRISWLYGTWEAYRSDDNLTLDLKNILSKKVPVSAVK
ncbi:conserved hypothetical protein [Gloeothece citriformis PCC 7424]|uniref:Uncharacterized protein n=1 Tax=Gloeothece citriformis (strain PCC 7424) TaxID=65393 RepID=B7KBD4_GLOC7|nr:hypothetical protein [Gloeothece citriformis]ACK71490.1 conserved hypothetical protein [Gloeothece citriformis PCC 7424]